MHLSGVQVPKLGSIQDRTFRAYMIKKVGREIAETQLLAQVAMGIGGSDKSWARTISSIWKDYIRATYYREAEQELLQQTLQEQYKKFSHLRPIMTVGKDGQIQVKGIPKSAL